ncbi:MAG: hypothetical protein WDW38_000603 [Sanguina aurantia]
MKISIELEIGADELPLASELLKTLRLLTEHVRIKATQAPALAFAPATAAAYPTLDQPGVHSQPQLGYNNNNGAPGYPQQQQPQQHQQPQPQAPIQAPQQQMPPAPAAPSFSAPAIPDIPPPSMTPMQVPAVPAALTRQEAPCGMELFDPMIRRLADVNQLMPVASEVAATLLDASLGTVKDLAAGFLEAFCAFVFSVDAVNSGQSVLPFMAVIPVICQDPICNKSLKTQTIAKVLSPLNMTRSVSADRTEFFCQAEAFAFLVRNDIIGLDGAVETMTRMIRRPNTRAAAVTMLGKTLELCSDKLLHSCSPEKLQKLVKALTLVVEPEFAYDITWCNSIVLGWNLDSNGRTLNGSLATASALTASNALYGHTDEVLSLSAEYGNHCMISGGKDDDLIVWGRDCKEASRIALRDYVTAMDVHPRNGMLIAGTVGRTGTEVSRGGSRVLAPPAYHFFDTKTGFSRMGHTTPPGRTFIGCLSAMGADCDEFVAGETTGNGQRSPSALRHIPPTNTRPSADAASAVQGELVSYYDMSQGDLRNLQPVHVWADHTSLVSSVTNFIALPDLVASGSSDGSIRVWDRRSKDCAGLLGGGPLHQGIITTIVASSTLIASTGTDGFMNLWDLRQLSSQGPDVAALASVSIDGCAILKMALAGSPLREHRRRLYFVNLANPTNPTITAATPFNDGRARSAYNNIKWAAGQPLLYAIAGGQSEIDVYTLS